MSHVACARHVLFLKSEVELVLRGGAYNYKQICLSSSAVLSLSLSLSPSISISLYLALPVPRALDVLIIAMAFPALLDFVAISALLILCRAK